MRNWADGKVIKKVEKRFLKVLKDDYSYVDGKDFYVAIDKAELVYAPDSDPLVELTIRYGRKKAFQNEIVIDIVDGSLDFLAGQFKCGMYFYDIYNIDGIHNPDGNK